MSSGPMLEATSISANSLTTSDWDKGTLVKELGRDWCGAGDSGSLLT